MEYFVYMTNDCNLHCEYCSVLLDCVKNNLPLTPSYANDELITFIQEVQKQEADEEVNLCFFGGEPTMEYDRILSLIHDINRSPLSHYKVSYILHTNGLLLDKIPDELLGYLKLIMLSINYEKIPKYSLGSGYFKTIVNNTLKIKSRSNLVIIGRLTITEKTSLYTELLQTAHYFDMVYWQIENCHAFADYHAFYKTYTFEMDETYRYWKYLLSRGMLLKYVPFMAVLKFMFFHDRDDYEFACGYGRGMVYVQTDGACYACCDSVETKEHCIGSLREGISLPKCKLDAFRCKQCPYRYICMGRCGRMHVEFCESHITEYCKLNQHMFNLFMRDRIEIQRIIEEYPCIASQLEDEMLEFTEFTP